MLYKYVSLEKCWFLVKMYPSLIGLYIYSISVTEKDVTGKILVRGGEEAGRAKNFTFYSQDKGRVYKFVMNSKKRRHFHDFYFFSVILSF